MITNLQSYDIIDVLVNNAAINALVSWRITIEAPLEWKQQNEVYPWMYVTKFEYMAKNNITKRAHVEISIVWWPTATAREIEAMFIAIDNELLPSIDWCLPISVWGTTDVIDIEQWSMSKAMRDAKENIIIRKTYNFTYLTQT